MKNTTTLLLSTLAATVLLFAGCSQPPTANVLTSADPTTGMVNVGSLVNFPFSGYTTTIFEDHKRRKTCYVLTGGGQSMSCVDGLESDVQVESLEVRLIPPVEPKDKTK